MKMRNNKSQEKQLPRIELMPPLEKEILADRETPVSVFEKINQGEYSFLLESVEGGERWARYSFLGCNPFLVFRLEDGNISIFSPDADGDHPMILPEPVVWPVDRGNLLQRMRTLLGSFQLSGPVSPHFPRFFGGGVGYFSYDLVRYFERLPELQPLRGPGPNFPDSVFIFTESLVVFDNIRKTLRVIATPLRVDGEGGEGPVRRAQGKITEILDLIRSGSPGGERPEAEKEGSGEQERGRLQEEFGEREFQEAVRKAKEMITDGEIIQVVLSRRWLRPFRENPFTIYRALRFLNPSPYMFFLRFRSEVLIGASPEALVRLEEGEVFTRPIAGTRRRGRDQQDDQMLEEELVNDEKERAEHVMLVDLGRNDIGKVAEVGSVNTTQFMTVERYSHVMHLVSEVQGKLRADKDALDVLAAVFPAGTVSGAPKIRAMEIIEELERGRRGPYAGSVGYFGYSGNMDMCITIRSIFLKDGVAALQSGAGIVADSDPERETRETEEKAEAPVRALELAEKGLD